MTEPDHETTADRGETIPGDDEIRRRAYDRYLARGRDPGRDVDDWLAAEREMRDGRRDDSAMAEVPAPDRAAGRRRARTRNGSPPAPEAGQTATPRVTPTPRL